MKKYTLEERIDVLNRHIETLCIEKNKGFTSLTQYVTFKNIEDFCDTIIHHENFNKLYGYTQSLNIFDRCTQLYKMRKKIFFSENRPLTEEETEKYLKEDKDFTIFFKKCKNKI